VKEKIENVILGGITEDQFISKVWGRNPFYSQDCFCPEEYFSIEELTGLLRESGIIRYGTTSVGKEKSNIFQPYESNFNIKKLKELKKLSIVESLYDVKACFDDGRGVLSHRLERFLPSNHKLRIIYNYLLEITGCVREELVIASFLTPPYSSTFDWHADSDHVFTMQIEGVKIWEVKNQDGVIETFQLSPGDVFYVPADTPHRVVSEGSTSLSISYVVVAKSYAQIFTTALLNKLKSDLDGALKNQTPLPFRWKENHKDIPNDEVVSGVFRKYGLEEQDFRNALIEEYTSDSISYLDETWNPNFRYTDNKLKLSTQLQKSSKTPIDLVRGSSENEIIILMSGRPPLSLSSKLSEALDFLNDIERRFRCDEFPDCYTENSKIFICTKLLQAGIIDFV